MSSKPASLDDSDTTKMKPTAVPHDTAVGDDEEEIIAPSISHSWRFWCVFLALCLISFISGLDATIVVTALPTITREIGGQSQYIWIANCFVIASTAPQPPLAQISNIFGRRNPMLLAIALFTVGSGISAGAINSAMLIAGRSIMGLGIGGAYVLLDVVCCDMVPLRERGKYLPSMLSAAAIGTTVGPVIGGSLAEKNWRWIFYLNLPISGLALAATFLFLNVKYMRNATWRAALTRVDFLGNAIFIPTIISILLGLVLGGTNFSWGVLPYHRTARAGLPWLGPFPRSSGVALLQGAQRSTPPISESHFGGGIHLDLLVVDAVKGTSPLTSGADFLPYACAIIPFSIAAGVLISKVGFYRPLHLAGFALNAIGVGPLALLGASSSKAAWVCYQMIAAAGTGILLSSVLPAILAALPESDVATAAGAYSFVRSFGYVWGVTIPSIVFNSQFDKNAYRIGDTATRAALANGAAYGFASEGFIPGLEPSTRAEVVGVYADALKTVWYVGAAFAAFGFFCVFVEKHVELRKELHTEYGLDESRGRGDSDSGGLTDSSTVVSADGKGEVKMMAAREEEEGRFLNDGPLLGAGLANAAVLGEKVVPVGMA
ncbi:hypothetical protein MMC25_003815 [Agyrium rufum]|nr:hypothetical protein [Agyrium rufum]